MRTHFNRLKTVINEKLKQKTASHQLYSNSRNYVELFFTLLSLSLSLFFLFFFFFFADLREERSKLEKDLTTVDPVASSPSVKSIRFVQSRSC